MLFLIMQLLRNFQAATKQTKFTSWYSSFSNVRFNSLKIRFNNLNRSLSQILEINYGSGNLKKFDRNSQKWEKTYENHLFRCFKYFDHKKLGLQAHYLPIRFFSLQIIYLNLFHNFYFLLLLFSLIYLFTVILLIYLQFILLHNLPRFSLLLFY